jgi:hypothetical protein
MARETGLEPATSALTGQEKVSEINAQPDPSGAWNGRKRREVFLPLGRSPDLQPSGFDPCRALASAGRPHGRVCRMGRMAQCHGGETLSGRLWSPSQPHRPHFSSYKPLRCRPTFAVTAPESRGI